MRSAETAVVAESTSAIALAIAHAPAGDDAMSAAVQREIQGFGVQTIYDGADIGDLPSKEWNVVIAINPSAAFRAKRLAVATIKQANRAAISS